MAIEVSPLDRSVTQGAQSAVSGGEIRSAFGELAAGLDEISNSAQRADIEQQRLLGESAVYTDTDGTLKYAKKNPLSQAGVAFNRSAQTAYVAQVSMDARPAVAQLEAKANGNVSEFDKLSQAYMKEMLKNKDPLIRGAVQNELGSYITQTRAGLIRQQTARDTQSQFNTLNARIKMADEDAAGIARTGGTHSKEYAQQLDTIKTLEKEKVSNPLFGYTKEESDVYLRGVEANHMSESIVGQVETIYQKQGMAAAQKFAETAFRDPTMGLSPGERNKYQRQALQALNQFKGEVRAEREDARYDATILIQQLSDGAPTQPEDIRAVAARLNASGDHIRAQELMQKATLADQLSTIKGMGEDQKLQVAMTGSLGGVDTFTNRIIGAESGGDANAANPNSSASGVGQFIDSTWLNTVKAHRPDVAAGKSDAEILALKNDKELGTEMTRSYAQDNADILKKAGLEPTAGNIYLAHFLGPGGAITALNANGSRRVSDIVAPGVLAANNFLTGMSVDDLRAWANKKMGGANLEPGAYKYLRSQFTENGKNLEKSMQAGFKRGEPYAQQDLNKLALYLGLSDDQEWKDSTVKYMTETGGYTSENLAEMQKHMDEADKNANSIIDKQILDDQRTVYENTVKAVAEDPLDLGRRVGMEGVKDITPIDFSDVTKLGNGLGRNAAAAKLVAQKYGSDSVGVFTKADAAQFKSVIATGDTFTAKNAMVSLTTIPDDVLKGTLQMKDVKEGLIGASKSRDYDKYSAAMLSMDALYNRAPQDFNRIMGKDTMDDLQDWQGRLRYMNADELQAEFKRRDDPNYHAKQQMLFQKGEDIAKKVDDVAIAEKLGAAQPNDALLSAAMSTDWQKIYAERFAATQNADTAEQQTIERLKQHWGTSIISGGALMLYPLEKYYPADENSKNDPYDWMKTQLNADLISLGHFDEVDVPDTSSGGIIIGTKTIQKPWPSALVADAKTEADIAAGRPPTYQLHYINPHTGQADMAQDENGAALRISFDSSSVQESARANFAKQNEEIRKKPLYVFHGRRGY